MRSKLMFYPRHDETGEAFDKAYMENVFKDAEQLKGSF
jgi:hypothetical protein